MKKLLIFGILFLSILATAISADTCLIQKDNNYYYLELAEDFTININNNNYNGEQFCNSFANNLETTNYWYNNLTPEQAIQQQGWADMTVYNLLDSGNEVPEFSTITALVALLGTTILLVYYRKKTR